MTDQNAADGATAVTSDAAAPANVQDADKADDGKKDKEESKELADLMVDDITSQCECQPGNGPCGIPDDTSVTVADCDCEEDCEFPDASEKGGKDTPVIIDPVENTGKIQSPIDINSSDLVVKNYSALVFSKPYCEVPCRMLIIRHDNYEVYLKYNSSTCPKIRGGPLKSPYKLIKFEFHWGPEDDKGSEHTIDGKSFIMELLAIHIEEKLKQDVANVHKNAYAIVSYLFELGENDHPAITELLDSFERLDAMEVAKNELPYIEIQKLFPVSDLFDLFSDLYMTYEGSLTTEPYCENVTWILAPYFIKISAIQMTRFRSLKLVKQGNYREIQEKHDRVINLAERDDNILRKMARKDAT